MNYWFTGDYHLGHANVIKYSNRPFKSLEHMNTTIIRNHNNRVKKDDTVFFLGDFCFKNTKNGKEGEGEVFKAEHYLSQLNGKFVFIRGNHDNNNSLKTCIEGVIIHLGGHDIYLVHNPKDYEPTIKLNFVAHVHEKWRTKVTDDGTLLYNVGIDVNGFQPIIINDILKNIQEVKNGKFPQISKN